MKFIYRILTIILAASTAVLNSCDNGYDCSLDNTAYNRINFYNINEAGIENKFEFPQTLTASLMINGNATVIVNNIYNASSLELPMSYTNECDTTILKYEGNITDTLYITHENIPYYISMECGTVMYHKILSLQYTKNFIDSAAIVNDYVKFDHNENIKLYLLK